MITDKVLKTLEYDKILKKLHMHCGCCVSRELADELRPKTEFDDVNAELRLTSEAETYFLRTGYSPIDDFPDIRSTLKRMNAALYLSCEELLNIAKALKAVRVAREQLTSPDSRAAAFGQSKNRHHLTRCLCCKIGMFEQFAIVSYQVINLDAFACGEYQVVLVIAMKR